MTETFTKIQFAENALRDLLTDELINKYKNDYLKKSGLSQNRIKTIEDRKVEEEKRFHLTGTIENKILYYSDLTDIQTIVDKQFDSLSLSKVFGKKKKIEVFLDELNAYRNPIAHSRGLLPHQAQLVEGIAQEIRIMIMKYRNDHGEKIDQYFPRFESVKDNLGHRWSYGEHPNIRCNFVLSPGDFLEFVMFATDPMARKLQFGLGIRSNIIWQDESIFKFEIDEEDISKAFHVGLLLKSDEKDYYGLGKWDDQINLEYQIVPKKR